MRLFSFLRLIVCPCCCVCGRRLDEGEQDICAACFFELPRPTWHAVDENPLLPLFYGRFRVLRAAALFLYLPGSDSSSLVQTLKFRNRPALGLRLGEQMAEEWLNTGLFSDVDCIVPVPLAADRQRSRGYNQSELLAEGMARKTGLPVEKTGVCRIVSNPSQTSVSRTARRENVEGVFKLLEPERFAGRHVLLVDDVVTTGATLTSLACEVAKAGDVRFSIAALAMTGEH